MITARAPEENVAACARMYGRAGRPIDHLPVAELQDLDLGERVRPVGANHLGDVAVLAHGVGAEVADEGGGVGPAAAVDRVVAAIAPQQVIAGPAVQGVVSAVAVEHIAVRARGQRGRSAGERELLVVEPQHLDVGHRIALPVTGDMELRAGVEVDDVACRHTAERQRVVA